MRFLFTLSRTHLRRNFLALLVRAVADAGDGGKRVARRVVRAGQGRAETRSVRRRAGAYGPRRHPRVRPSCRLDFLQPRQGAVRISLMDAIRFVLYAGEHVPVVVSIFLCVSSTVPFADLWSGSVQMYDQ